MSLHASRVVVVGDELLAGFTRDANGALAAQRLFQAGYPVRRIEIIGDGVDDIATAVRGAVADNQASRILVCGGVGPTPDDRTHEGIALALGRDLAESSEAMGHIEALVVRMHAAGWLASPVPSAPNRRMARVAAGGQVLENRRGMAPPVAYEVGDDRWLFVLPGVPREFAAILEEVLIPGFFGDGTAATVVELQYPSTPESELADPMRRLEIEYPDVMVGSYPQTERRHLIIRVRGQDPARVGAAVRRLRELRPEPATQGPA